jgi:hypothetical protein
MPVRKRIIGKRTRRASEPDPRPVPKLDDVRPDERLSAGMSDPRGPYAKGGVDVGTPNLSESEARTHSPQSSPDARRKE